MPNLIGTKPHQVPVHGMLGRLAYRDYPGIEAHGAPAPAIDSAATIQPVTPVAIVSGAATISTITVPPEMVGGGQITLIPTGLWSTDTSGNIALATAAVLNRALILTYDTATAKWYPSY